MNWSFRSLWRPSAWFTSQRLETLAFRFARL
jgi:hypothetical protein